MFDNDDNITTYRTLKNMRNALKQSLKTKYNIEDDDKIDQILSIHGITKDRFDFIKTIESTIMDKLNDVSIDANSNKNEKTIEAITQEAIAPVKKAIGYDFLYRQMKILYGKEEAKRLTGEMYDLSLGLSDSTNIMKCYCWALDASKLVTIGREFGQLWSKPSKRVSSYISALCETIHQMSSHLAGAIAIGTFFLDVAHLSLFKEQFDLRELKTNSEFRKKLENEFQQFIHSVNHLSRNGSESPFTNISVFDRIKLKSLINDMSWYFPFEELPINHPKELETEEQQKEFYINYIIDYVMEIQNIFLDFFDKGDVSKDGLPYRFPLVTVNISKKKWGDKEIIEDLDFLKSICKREIYRYNIFTSEGTKISSCCFSGNEIIKIKTKDGESIYSSLKNFVELYSEDLEFEQKIPDEYYIDSLNNENKIESTKILGVLKKKNNTGKLISITSNGRNIKITPDHILKVLDKTTKKEKEITALELKNNFNNYLIPLNLK